MNKFLNFNFSKTELNKIKKKIISSKNIDTIFLLKYGKEIQKRISDFNFDVHKLNKNLIKQIDEQQEQE
ncbi:MAG: hypothetical protein GDA46_04560 [Bdellovibrionales bacterium]|nr:hypothetical protein [Bdellovibrionales bacterium]